LSADTGVDVGVDMGADTSADLGADVADLGVDTAVDVSADMGTDGPLGEGEGPGQPDMALDMAEEGVRPAPKVTNYYACDCAVGSGEQTPSAPWWLVGLAFLGRRRRRSSAGRERT